MHCKLYYGDRDLIKGDTTDPGWVAMKRAENPPAKFIQVLEAFKCFWFIGFLYLIKHIVNLVKKEIELENVLLLRFTNDSYMQ